jgi:hypothetical protein
LDIEATVGILYITIMVLPPSATDDDDDDDDDGL